MHDISYRACGRIPQWQDLVSPKAPLELIKVTHCGGEDVSDRALSANHPTGESKKIQKLAGGWHGRDIWNNDTKEQARFSPHTELSVPSPIAGDTTQVDSWWQIRFARDVCFLFWFIFFYKYHEMISKVIFSCWFQGSYLFLCVEKRLIVSGKAVSGAPSLLACLLRMI